MVSTDQPGCPSTFQACRACPASWLILVACSWVVRPAMLTWYCSAPLPCLTSTAKHTAQPVGRMVWHWWQCVAIGLYGFVFVATIGLYSEADCSGSV